VSDVVGGTIALHPRLTELSQRYAIALASGIVISAALLELLPASDIETNAIYVVIGFFTFYFIEKIMLLHACGEKECESHAMGWTAVAGMASDNFIDGIGIAVAYLTDPNLGLIITIAVVIHEIPQGMASTVIMQKEGYNITKIYLILIIAGISYPIGALLSSLFPPELYTVIIAFVAGDFLYIGAGDLLVEAHRKFNYKVVLTTLFGALFFFIVETII
jgi:zinc transporter ZupT